MKERIGRMGADGVESKLITGISEPVLEIGD